MVQNPAPSSVRVSPPHGSRARYVHRTLACRCGPCRAANTAYIAAYRARPHTTARRLWVPDSWEQLTLEVHR